MLHLQLNEIKLKKKSLVDKLMEIQKMVKSPQYDIDFSFGEKINLQLKAVKTLIEEQKQKENELKEELKEQNAEIFIVEKLNMTIAIKRDQLKNLMREHKLRKVKDKNVVHKLKEKYKGELEKALKDKEELVDGIKLWIEDMIDEKSEVSTAKSFNKARYSSKEILEDEFKEKDVIFEKKLDKVISQIETLTKLAK